MDFLKDKTLWWLLGITVLLRLPLFFPTVIDHDESTYLVIANEILKGKILYVDLIDLKPPGVFWFFAAIQWLFGKSIILVRFIDALLIGVAAFLLFRIQKYFKGTDTMAWMTAIFFIAMFSLHHFTLSFNNEHLMTLLTLAGFVVLLKRDTPLRAFLCGLVVGLGFIVKYLVLFDITALGVFYLVSTWQKKNSLQATLAWALHKGGLMLSGFLVVPLLTYAYFYFGEYYDAFHFITFEAPGNYAAPVPWWERLRYLADFHIAYLFYLPFFYWMLFKKRVQAEEQEVRIFAGIWFVFTLLSAQATGKMFPHYWLQIVPAIALLAGRSAPHISFFKKIDRYLWKGIPAWPMVLSGFILFGIALNFFTRTIREDYPEKIHNWLASNLEEGELFYPANIYQILYYLHDQSPLTPYVHSTLMVREGHVRTLEIDTEYWLDQVKKQNPQYILVEKDYEIESFQEYIEEEYRLEKTFKERFHIWKRIR
jgi:4-amino-4-deoxy-L-arabinose transferase-like glycosyltransferase